MPCPLPRRTRRVRASLASPSARPSPVLRRVGVRDFTFEACSGFTHVTACRIARSPKATFVTRLRPGGLPLRTARQLPAQPTTRWVEPSSTGKPRPPGARRVEDGRGGLGHAATLRFPSPLIKPDVRICRVAQPLLAFAPTDPIVRRYRNGLFRTDLRRMTHLCHALWRTG